MPTVFSKIINKVACHTHRHTEKHTSNEHHHHENHNKFHIKGPSPAAAITTHVFGYRDGIKDNYVEPPPGNYTKNNQFVFFFRVYQNTNMFL